MKHELKIDKPFAEAVCDGFKKFEVRRNDRGYNKGDIIEFHCLDHGDEIKHRINGRKYRITYVLSGHGLREAYVVFGIEDVTKDDR